MEKVIKVQQDVGIETYVVKSIHVQRGDLVKKGDLLAVIESSKICVEIRSEFSGLIFDVLVHEGDKVKSGNAVARLQQDYLAVITDSNITVLRQGDVYGSWAV